jgi:hypothetical protein
MSRLDHLEQRKLLLLTQVDQYEADVKAIESEKQRLELMKKPLQLEINREQDKQKEIQQAIHKVKMENYFYGDLIVQRETLKFEELVSASNRLM